MKKKITLNNAGMVETPKEKQMVITDFSTACVGCVYSRYPRECAGCKYRYQMKTAEKKYDSN